MILLNCVREGLDKAEHQRAAKENVGLYSIIMSKMRSSLENKGLERAHV